MMTNLSVNVTKRASFTFFWSNHAAPTVVGLKRKNDVAIAMRLTLDV